MLLYLLKVTSICILRDPNCHLWIQKGWNYTHFGYSFFSNFTYMYIQMKKCVLYICIHVKGPGLSPFWVCAVWCLIHIKERGLLVTLTWIKHCHSLQTHKKEGVIYTICRSFNYMSCRIQNLELETLVHAKMLWAKEISKRASLFP